MFDYLNNVKAPDIIKLVSKDELQSLILNYPDEGKISQLYPLDKVINKKEYDKIKYSLPCIKVHANFDGYGDMKYFKNFTGYIYIDIDEFPDSSLEETKQKLLNEFPGKIYMLGKSCGGKGLFFLIKLKNPEVLTLDNFNSVHHYFRTEIFKNYITDKNAGGANRSFVIPSDKNLIVDREPKEFYIDLRLIDENEFRTKKDSCTSSKESTLNTDNSFTGFIPIAELLQTMNNQTVYDTGEYDALVEDHQSIKVFFKKPIPDGEKHSTFRGLVNSMVFNNPDFKLLQVQSYINYVNQKYTMKRPMEFREMMRTTEAEFNRIKETGKVFGTEKRGIAIGKNVEKGKRKLLANKLNGKVRRNKTLRKIKWVYEHLKKEGKTPTDKMVADILKGKLSLDRIKKYWDIVLENDFNEITKIEIEGYKIKDNTIERFSKALTDSLNDGSKINIVVTNNSRNLNNEKLKQESTKKIEEAINVLIEEGKKVNEANVVKISGLSRSTVQRIKRNDLSIAQRLKNDSPKVKKRSINKLNKNMTLGCTSFSHSVNVRQPTQNEDVIMRIDTNDSPALITTFEQMNSKNDKSRKLRTIANIRKRYTVSYSVENENSIKWSSSITELQETPENTVKTHFSSIDECLSSSDIKSTTSGVRVYQLSLWN